MSLLTAYYKGLVDILTIVVSDTIISIPLFLLVLLLSVVFQQANHPIADVYNGGLLLALIFGALYCRACGGRYVGHHCRSQSRNGSTRPRATGKAHR